MQRAKEAGVIACLAIAVDSKTAADALLLAESHPGVVFPTAGLHPTEHACGQPDELARVSDLLESGQFVAVGETGLDAYHDTIPMDVQISSLRHHITLSLDQDLPVILHCRDAFDEILGVVQQFGGSTLRGVLHCFTGTMAHMESLVSAGLHIGFGGIVTFKPRSDLRDIARKCPIERLLVETDAPWLAPVPMRGHRNEPAFVVHTARCVAETRREDFGQFAQQTTQNASDLFGLVLPTSETS